MTMICELLIRPKLQYIYLETSNNSFAGIGFVLNCVSHDNLMKYLYAQVTILTSLVFLSVLVNTQLFYQKISLLPMFGYIFIFDYPENLLYNATDTGNDALLRKMEPA